MFPFEFLSGNQHNFNFHHFRCPPDWRLGEKLTTPHRKEAILLRMSHRASEFVGSCGHGNEPSGSIKSRVFFD
jgi:hypothetical protein